MPLALYIIIIVTLGYISNWLNWRFLNYKLTHYLYYIGAAIHEISHGLLCLITGAKISEFKIISIQPHVTHTKSRWPIIGNMLISSAPIFGGLVFLFIINHFILSDYFSLVIQADDWHKLISEPLRFIAQLNILHWQSWIMLLLLINIGAMLGPSIQDLKNMWLAIAISFFIYLPVLDNLFLLAIDLIIVNIVVQTIAIIFILIKRRFV